MLSHEGFRTTADALTLDVFVPLVLHPAKHLFLAAGPYIDADLLVKVGPDDRTKVATIGLRGEIGGWL